MVDQRIEHMTLEAKSAQLIFADFRFKAPDFDKIFQAIKAGIGGICTYGGSIFDFFPTINSFQKRSSCPLLICSDLEDGAGHQVDGATIIPCNMAVAATGSTELAELKGKITAVEAAALGIHIILAPVVDISRNPLNPIVNTRAFGDSPDAVISFARAYIRGCSAGGARTCIKHFPGHGGTSEDSHLKLPVVDDPENILREGDLKPFRALASDTDCVMTAHIVVKALDGARPASLSRKITHDILREEFGFKGVIMTDALVMGAVADAAGEDEAALAALDAGADVLLYPRDPLRTIAVIAKAVRDGIVSEERIDRSLERIFELKTLCGLFPPKLASAAQVERRVGTKPNKEIAQRIADASITLVRDKEGLLPLGEKGKLALVEIEGIHQRFVRELQEAGAHISTDDASVPCVIAVSRSPTAYKGAIALTDDEVRSIEAVVAKYRRVVVVSFGNPYIVRQIPSSSAFVCAYSPCDAAQSAAARALLGKIPFSGKLPVEIAR